jgi:hypothetical protein
MAEETCSHLNAITKVKRPTRRECEECVKNRRKLGPPEKLVKRAV